MARTNVSDVEAIYDTGSSEVDVSAWIDIANELVDDIADADSSIDSTRLTKIEKLLAAHLASAQDPRAAEDSVGDSSMVYQGEWGMRIESTTYGQQAAMLDPTGTLQNVGKQKASIGLTNSRNIDRPDRD